MAYRDMGYVEQLHPRLQEICSLLSDIDMTEDDCDLNACSFCNYELRRCVYVCLDLETGSPENCEMHYDLEDYKSDSKDWDKAIERGIVENQKDFINKARKFLTNGT